MMEYKVASGISRKRPRKATLLINVVNVRTTSPLVV
uniref:Uncharacterized protein n=1 Tax=Brassica oleracea TaxID=3712 RepID=A0A3P6CM80_BRAOL|nr:unnamed protein product [Brassica oleracea]